MALGPSARAELVGSWSFNDSVGTTLTDSSGHGNNGTLVGGPAWAAGHTGGAGDYALSFSGSNYVDLGNPTDLAIIGDQTIAMWIYPTDFSARRNPYAKAYSGSGTLTQEISAGSTSAITYYYGNYGGNGPGWEQRTFSPITLNAWNFVVITRDLEPVPGTGQITTYVNGVATASYTPTFTSPDGPNPVVADSLTAYFAHGYVSNYVGSIDESQIYNVALSKQEVKWLFTHSGGVPTWDGSVGTWDTAGSWSTGAVPDLTGPDTARVESGTVTYTTAGNFVIDGGTSLNLAGTGTWRKGAAGSVVIGQSGEGTVNQTGGTLDASLADNVRLGSGAGSVGNYNLNGGTLIVKSIDQGAGTANFGFSGGTLQAAAAFTTALPMTVGAGGATIDTHGFNVGLSGNLAKGSGNGGLSKTGAGTLTLDGVLAYTGGTTIDEGTLVLAKSGLTWTTNGQFGSSHTLTVNPGATLDLQATAVTGLGQACQINVNGGTLKFSIDNY